MRAGPWRRLAPVVAVVLLAHLALLAWLQPAQVLRAARQDVAWFATRTIVPEAQAAPVPQAAAAMPLPELLPQPVMAARPPARRPAAAPLRSEAERRPASVATAAPVPQAAEADAAAAEPEVTVLAAGPRTAPAAPPAPAAATRAADPAPATRTVVAVPPSARFHYDVAVAAKGFSLRGKGELDWRHDGRQYEAKLEISSPMLPSRVQRSTGRITEDGLAPGYFWDKTRNEQAAHFDRAKGVVIFSNNRPQADLVPGLQDRLSVLLQLAAMVRGQPARFVAGTDIAIPTASTRETEGWVFEVEGEENLQLPGGAVRALKLHRKPRKEFDQRLELWLAPRMDYAPVRVRLTNPNGDAVDQRWSSTDKG